MPRTADDVRTRLLRKLATKREAERRKVLNREQLRTSQINETKEKINELDKSIGEGITKQLYVTFKHHWVCFKTKGVSFRNFDLQVGDFLRTHLLLLHIFIQPFKEVFAIRFPISNHLNPTI